MECFKSEIFGPVVAVKRFSTEKVGVKCFNCHGCVEPSRYF